MIFPHVEVNTWKHIISILTAVVSAKFDSHSTHWMVALTPRQVKLSGIRQSKTLTFGTSGLYLYIYENIAYVV
jgi:hypothetical protein